MATRKVFGAFLLAAGFAATGAQAALIAYDGFNYAATTDVNGLNGGSGFSGGYVNGSGSTTLGVSSTGLTYTNPGGAQALVSVGGSLELPAINASASRARRSLTTPLGAAGGAGATFWVSMLVRDKDLTPNVNGENQMTLYQGTASPNQFAEGAYLGKRGNKMNWVHKVKWNPSDTTVDIGSTYAAAQTYLLVSKITWDTTSKLLTATSGAYRDGIDLLPTVEATAVSTGPTTTLVALTSSSQLSSVGFFSFPSSGYSRNMAFDELRIGNSLADVVPIVDVPEPTSMALASGLGVFAMARRRKTA